MMTSEELQAYQLKIRRDTSAVFEREHQRRKVLGAALNESAAQTLFRLAEWSASERAASLFGVKVSSAQLNQYVITRVEENPGLPLNRAEILSVLFLGECSVFVKDFVRTEVVADYAPRRISIAHSVKLEHPSFTIERACESQEVLVDVLESVLIDARLRLNMAVEDVWTSPQDFLEHSYFVSRYCEFLNTKKKKNSLKDIVSQIQANMKTLGIGSPGPVFVYENGDWGIPIEMLDPCHLRISRWEYMENRISMMMTGSDGAQDRPVRGTMKHIWDSKISGGSSPVRLAIELMTHAQMSANIEIYNDWEMSK